MPILATSGLDDDIKIWVPSCENEPDLTGLRKVNKFSITLNNSVLLSVGCIICTALCEANVYFLTYLFSNKY